MTEQVGQNLLGTGEFDRTLLEHKLVDEYHFWLLFSAFVGCGQKEIEERSIL